MLRRSIGLVGLTFVFGLGLGLGLGTRSEAEVRAAGDIGYWQAAMGDFLNLSDVLVLADDDIWAVGDGVVHYDGSSWHQVLDAARPQFHAIAGLSADALWAVGEIELEYCERQGIIYGWDGRRWRSVDPGHHAPIYDVAMVTADEAWAVGGFDQAAILHFDGLRWRAEDAPEIAALRALQVLAPDDVWAVGDRGAIAHYDGFVWSAVEAPYFAWLRGLHMRPGGAGWAVGLDAPSRSGIALVYGGGRWSVDMIAESPALTGVHGLGAEDAVAVGDRGAILRRDGSGWREIGRTNPGGFEPWFDPPAPATREAAIDAIAGLLPDSHDQAFDSGRMLHALAELPGQKGLIAVGDFGQVVRIDDALRWSIEFAGRSLHAIDMLSADEGWVVGEMGPPMRWHDGAWRAAPAPALSQWLRDVVTLSPELAWAVGERGTIMRWDGSAWAEAERFTWFNLSHLSFAAPDDGWVIAYEPSSWEGGNSDIPATQVYHWDGRVWNLRARLCDTSITDVLALPGGKAWFATGSRDAVLHYDGRAFTWHPIWGWEDPAGAYAVVTRLLRTRGGEIIGSGIGLARLDDGVWRSIGEAPDDPYAYYYRFYPVSAESSSGELWGLSRGRVYRVDRDGTAQVLPVSPISLYDLDLVRAADGRDELWAIGDRSTLLRYRIPDEGSLPQATATRVLPRAELYPTPTPYAELDRAAARARVVEIVDPEETGAYRLDSLELMSLASYRRFGDDALLEYWEGDYFWWGGGDFDGECEADSSRSVWLARFSDSPICASHVAVAINGRGGSGFELRCYLRKLAELYLPLVVAYRPKDPNAPTPTPTVTPSARQLTPEPADSILGPCPTRTPQPRPVFPGYPGP